MCEVWEKYKTFFVMLSNMAADDSFACAYCVVDRDGRELEADTFEGSDGLDRYGSISTLWDRWEHWRCRGAAMVGARPSLLSVGTFSLFPREIPSYEDSSRPPFFIDVATARVMAGKDPVARVARLPEGEEPSVGMLSDCRHELRLLLEAMNTTRNWREEATGSSRVQIPEYYKDPLSEQHGSPVIGRIARHCVVCGGYHFRGAPCPPNEGVK